ncbi:Diacylglycerol kinase [Coniosporium apollinis]|uniref:Diacylglycerol kinase n=1 Tax=Coniosporium apollinis TaxID=61459 RepID=A0ABQ9P5K0_9PEZI|nr:Diacylglycerol kinase [Coniosporium apollinis]
MASTTSAQYQIPSTRIISPSPTPSESSGRDSYFGPTTRSKTRANRRINSPQPISEDADSSGSELERRARSRSRESLIESRKRRLSGLTAVSPKAGMPSAAGSRRKGETATANGAVVANGHLSPSAANRNYWREISRSPSPLGLIPIHQRWRSFIHRHEIPRKVLHVSIGFLAIYLYASGTRQSRVHPLLLSLLVPIAATDVIRHRYPAFNRFYITCLGALMRESEVDGWNGVIWYLLGTWIVMRFFPKDIAVVSIMLLSWCDTAASTFGRLWGRYTWRVRKGKSAAGTIAALVCGVLTAGLFWGYVAPTWGTALGVDTENHRFAFWGVLRLPEQARELLGWSESQATLTGNMALGVMSLWGGLVAAASEAVDLFGWDDNLTIPVLCSAGLWGFLKIFG